MHPPLRQWFLAGERTPLLQALHLAQSMNPGQSLVVIGVTQNANVAMFQILRHQNSDKIRANFGVAGHRCEAYSFLRYDFQAQLEMDPFAGI